MGERGTKASSWIMVSVMVVTYLGSLVEGGAFLGSSLKVDDFGLKTISPITIV
jgi:hypothetical protein